MATPKKGCGLKDKHLQHKDYTPAPTDTVRVRLNTTVFHCGIYVPEGTEAEVLLSDLTYVSCEGREKAKLTVKFDGFEGKLCECDVDETKSSLFIWKSWIDVIAQSSMDLKVDRVMKLSKLDRSEPARCRFCGYSVVTDDNVYVCEVCDSESCPECAGRCGCEIQDLDD